MAHFAEINLGNNNESIVSRVVVVDNTNILDSDGNESEEVGATFMHNLLGGTWKQASYNTRSGKHYDQDGNEDGSGFRKNMPGRDWVYDSTRDAFIEPKPFASWILNESTCRWECSVAHPDDGKEYDWDEPTVSWVEVT